MSPLFSVLLPTHDRADVVGFAIESVLAQTEPDFELLVVGDGCSDDTAGVVRSFDDERVRWFDLPKAPNFGYANRNVALREAAGELIAFMAHDDLLFPDHLERMSRRFHSPNVEWAYSRPLWIDDDGTTVPFAVDLRRPDAFEWFMGVGNSIPASCVVHRRTCLERYSYWPEEVPEAGDLTLWRRIVGPSAGANLEYEPTVTCLHFRAHWRTGPTWGPPPLSDWLESAVGDWWPEDLLLRVPDGLTPQAHAWSLMAADREGWSRRVREATVDVVDGFAWDWPKLREQLLEETNRTDALRAEVASHSAQEQDLTRRQERLGAQIEAMQNSTSWRITEPFRAAGRLVRRAVRKGDT